MTGSSIRRSLTAAIFVFATFAARPKFATSTINGAVTDPGGAVVTGAT